MNRVIAFAPVFAEDARVLILGTAPSVESLRQGFYYGHPRNAFWHIMAELTESAFPENIGAKKRLLLRKRIALWDVAATCEREGSLDSAIRDVRANDIPGILRQCPQIERILFNGAKAEALYHSLIGGGPEGMRMPSTSPAYTLAYEKKKEAWKNGLEVILNDHESL